MELRDSSVHVCYAVASMCMLPSLTRPTKSSKTVSDALSSEQVMERGVGEVGESREGGSAESLRAKRLEGLRDPIRLTMSVPICRG